MSKKDFIFYFRLLFILLVCSFSMAVTQANVFNRENKTCVYDTIFAYDTIWTYETIFDTVWVYDTLFIDETIIAPRKLPPNITKFIKLPGTEEDLSSNLFIPHPDFSALSSGKTGHQQKFSQTAPARRNGNHISGTKPTVQLTLNPFRGKFDPSVFRNGDYSVEAFSGINFQNVRYRFLTDDSRNQDLQSATKALAGFDYGLRLNYHLAQVMVQTGLGWSRLREQFDYSVTSLEIDSSIQSVPVHRITTIPDSAWVLDPDQLQKGDTVWTFQVFYFDSLTVVDSVFQQYDTTRIVVPHSEIVSHNVLEIPLIFSWNWKFSDLDLGIKAGAINQLHLYSVGKAYSDYNTVGEAEDVVQFSRYNISLYGGISGNYPIDRRLSIGMEAWYKYPLLKSEERFNARVYRDTYGFSVLLRYYLSGLP